jgi:hypothetical protein
MSVIERVGRFDDSVFSGGDRMWGERASALGVRSAYDANAIVFHPARSTLPDLLSRSRRVAAEDLRRFRASGRSGIRLLAGESKDEIRFVASRWMRILKRRREFGPVSTCGALAVAAIVVCTKIGECFRLAFGGRPHR